MTETRKFDAEVGKVLHLMIHSLYTNKDIFMRELVSNASDACDKLRYLSLTDPSLVKGDPDLKIIVKIDKEARLISVRDNGIGMDEKDLIENLGTVARSGTQNFASALSGDQKKDSALIGQFGVGFYSCFMVAESVEVKSKKAGTDKAYKWVSDGCGEYSVSSLGEDFSRGTEVMVRIKEGEEDFLDHFRIKHITKTYSDHISVPIYFEGEGGEPVKLNSSSALWARPKSEIGEGEYKEFYKNLAYSPDDPWITMHNKNEGTVEFTNLLYVPSSKTFDLFHPDRKRRVKLYIKRVFISDENIDLIPHYMRFLRGVVDSEDLPLNISRESLQHNSTLEKIKSSITKRVLAELKKKKEEAPGEYNKFWENFGSVLKEGLCEAIADHEKLLEVCLFRSALLDKNISLDDYIKEAGDRKIIYYLSGDDYSKLKNSPQIEGLLSKNIDVALLTDPVDDFWININNNYKGYELKSATRSDLDLESGEKKEKSRKDDTEYTELSKYFKEILGEKVKEVKISKKLTSSPSCLAVGEGSMDIRMERFLIEQKQLSAASAKILELNPKHPVVKSIYEKVKSKETSEEEADLVRLLFDQACVVEGEPIPDVAGFVKRLNYLYDSVLK